MGTRHHFDRLLKSEWIETRKSEKDARVKIVLPSTKLLKRLNLLSNNLEQTFNEHQTKFNLDKVIKDSHQTFIRQGLGDSKV